MRRIEGLRIAGKEVLAHGYFYLIIERCRHLSATIFGTPCDLLNRSDELIIPGIVHVDTKLLRRISHTKPK